MIPIRFLKFQTYSESSSIVDLDLLCLCLCIKNAWGLEDRDLWLREVENNIELAFVLSFTRDLKSVHTLIAIDEMLAAFRKRKFNVGEIKPQLASYCLITLEKE